MANVLYTAGADLLANIESDTYKWLIAKSGYTPDADGDVFVSDVSSELTGAGYTRPTLTGGSRTPGTGVIVYDADDPAFGSVAAGETGKWLILFQFVTNDSDSPLVCALGINVPTTGAALVILLSDDGIASLAQAA